TTTRAPKRGIVRRYLSTMARGNRRLSSSTRASSSAASGNGSVRAVTELEIMAMVRQLDTAGREKTNWGPGEHLMGTRAARGVLAGLAILTTLSAWGVAQAGMVVVTVEPDGHETTLYWQGERVRFQDLGDMGP